MVIGHEREVICEQQVGHHEIGNTKGYKKKAFSQEVRLLACS